MDGLFFLMSIAGAGMVMCWAVRNDRVRPDKPTTGFFAMPVRALVRVKRSRRLTPAVHGPAEPASRVPWPRS
jgi:hypothetical protein